LDLYLEEEEERERERGEKGRKKERREGRRETGKERRNEGRKKERILNITNFLRYENCIRLYNRKYFLKIHTEYLEVKFYDA
jgi:hypothetical protein